MTWDDDVLIVDPPAEGIKTVRWNPMYVDQIGHDMDNQFWVGSSKLR